MYGHSPDRTYNHFVSELTVSVLEAGDWKENESRSLEMEYEVFNKLRGYNGTTGKNQITGRAIRFRDINDFLEAWNRKKSTSEKIDDLAFKLEEFGLGGARAFNLQCAAAKRKAYLGGSRESDFPGTILPLGIGTLIDVRASCGE